MRRRGGRAAGRQDGRTAAPYLVLCLVLAAACGKGIGAGGADSAAAAAGVGNVVFATTKGGKG